MMMLLLANRQILLLFLKGLKSQVGGQSQFVFHQLNLFEKSVQRALRGIQGLAMVRGGAHGNQILHDK